jgi:hypothetical protein
MIQLQVLYYRSKERLRCYLFSLAVSLVGKIGVDQINIQVHESIIA